MLSLVPLLSASIGVEYSLLWSHFRIRNIKKRGTGRYMAESEGVISSRGRPALAGAMTKAQGASDPQPAKARIWEAHYLP
jgi:hypothetical protein